MPKYKVWDDYNCDEEDAQELEESDAESAALKYAENDEDGRTDGLYFGADGYGMQNLEKNGQPIMVREEDGTLHRFHVGITEFEPIYSAVEVPIAKKEEEAT